MNKGVTIFLLAIFIAGSLPVFAENEEKSNDRLVKIEQLKERIQEHKALTAAQKTKIRSSLTAAKQTYEVKKLELRENQGKILEMKEQWKECKDSDEEDCQDIKREFLGYGKNYVARAADVLLKYLEQLYNKVELSDMDDEEKKEALTEIQEQIDAVEAAKAKAEAAETKEELRDALDELKDLLKEYRIKIRHRVASLFRHKVGEIIVRAERLEIKLEKILDRAEEAGYDTEQLSDLIDEFNALIETARDNYYEAKEILEEFHSDETTDSDKVKEAHELLKQAHRDLNAAQKILREILHEIKGISDEFIGETETCWEDRPDYRPGYDLGYFIWQGDCRDTWHVDWSGDMRQVAESITNERPNGYIMEGSIKVVDGEFVNVGVKAFDRFDKFEWTDNEITFKAWVGPHFDGIHFQTTSNVIEFDLYVDGEHNTELVYIGKDWENPTEIPFVLEGEAVVIDDLEIVCEDGQLLVKNECVDEIEEMEIEEITGNGKKYEVAVPMDTI